MRTKEKLFLVTFGTLLGMLFVVPVLVYVFEPKAGSSFASLEEFNRALSERDNRDVRVDGSVSLRSIIEAHPSPDIIYTLRPNLSVRFQGVDVRTNSFGMRQGEVSKTKEEGVFRIAVLGDSFTFGWGVKEEEAFPKRLEAFLNERAQRGPRVEVLNFGVPGYSTFQEVARYLEFGAQFEPDLVLVFFVNNDFGLPFFIGTNEGPLVNAVDFVRSAWRSKDEAIKKKNREITSRIDANKALLRLQKELNQKGVPLFVALNPTGGYEKDKKRLYAPRRNKRIRFVSLKEPVDALITERKVDKSTLSLPTDPHPSPVKHELLGIALADALESEVLRNRE